MFYFLFLIALLGFILHFLAAVGREKTLPTFSDGIILSGNTGYASKNWNANLEKPMLAGEAP